MHHQKEQSMSIVSNNRYNKQSSRYGNHFILFRRVSIFLEGVKQIILHQVAKGHEGRWLFVTHEPKDLNNWYDSIDFNYDTSKFPENASARSILYKFEPLILHVKCRESMAQKLYVLAMNNGFRESGIGNNFNVAIRMILLISTTIHPNSPKMLVQEVYYINLNH